VVQDKASLVIPPIQEGRKERILQLLPFEERPELLWRLVTYLGVRESGPLK
jgi:hypothetical protein